MHHNDFVAKCSLKLEAYFFFAVITVVFKGFIITYKPKHLFHRLSHELNIFLR